jgi:hypothetical protein
MFGMTIRMLNVAKLPDGENNLLQKADRCRVIGFVVESREREVLFFTKLVPPNPMGARATPVKTWSSL